jgi:DNA-binding winged helix-turn-helix (wHTH) protein
MPIAAPLAFDRFVVDRAKRRLLFDGKPVVLNGKVFDLLLILASSHGAALSRETLYDSLWPHTVVEDGNLSQTIHLLRRSLDPTGDGRSYIETIPRFGYRFVKDVREVTKPGPRFRRITWSIATSAVAALAVIVWSTHAAVEPASARIAYALGEYHLNLRTPTDLSYAAGYFKEVQRDEPRSASGYAGSASADALLAEFRDDGSPAQRQLVSLAKRDVASAFSYDPNSADALAVSAFIAYRFDSDRAAAERRLERALAEDPNSAAAHHWRGVVLLAEGKLAAAIGEFETAHRLQPTSEVFSRWLARAYTYAHRSSDAIALATQSLRIERDDAPAWLAIACAQEQRGDLREALQTLKTLGNVAPYELPYVIPDEARLEVRLEPERQRSLSSIVDRLTAAGRADPFETALYYLTVGRRARALDLLRTSKRSPIIASIEGYDPRFRSLI